MVLTQHSFDKVSLSTSETFCMISYSLTYEGKRQSPVQFLFSDYALTAVFGNGCSIEDVFSPDGDFLTLKRTWKLSMPGTYRLQASFSYDDEELENTLFIPSVWYQDNTSGKGCFPSKTYAETWSFLETRMSIPCCAQLSNGKRLFTCSTEPTTDESHLASVANDRHGLIISIPGSEWPYSYQGKQSLVDTSKLALPTLQVGPQGHTYTRTFFLGNQKEHDSLSGYARFVAFLGKKEQSKAKNLQLPTWDAWFEYKLTRLINLVQADQNNLGYVMMGEGNKEVQDVYCFTSASFLVKSIQAAYELTVHTAYEPRQKCLIEAKQRLADRFGFPNDGLLLAKVAKAIGDFFLQAEQSNGIFQDNYDLKKNIWGGYLGIGEHPEFQYMVNSRCNGEAMKYYCLLSIALKRLDIDEREYIGLGRRVARFYCESQLSNGSFGRWWTEKGKPGDTQGTNGAYIGSFFCSLIPLLNDNDPLKQEMLSAVHHAYTYYSELAFEGAFYGDTLDADSCDKEAGVALLSFFLDLWELEQDKRHLESARLAVQFLVQWIWQQASYLPEESPLGRLGFSTKGMTSVSVAHHHLDFYGMAIGYEFLRYAEATHDMFYYDQAILMIEACRQLVATEQQFLGRDERFIGWQAEQLNHTMWEYFDRPTLMNGHFDIDIAWVTVLTLGAYQRIKQQFPDVLGE